MRSYIVIPGGTPVVRVDASDPRFAASKARRGKGERTIVPEATVLAESAAMECGWDRSAYIPGQMRWTEDGRAVEA